MICKTFQKISYLLLAAFFATGCCRSSCEVWDDTKTCARHMNNGLNSLFGKQGKGSRQVCRKDDFYSNQYPSYGGHYPEYAEFTPLEQDPQDQYLAAAEKFTPQAKEAPGDFGSSIPGIEAFEDPSYDATLSAIFQPIYFDYDSSLIRGGENLKKARKIAQYLSSHPNTYIFVEGHCDERGPQAYNFALGARRANSMRTLLIKEGADPDQIFTISYGKEKPLVDGHDESAWKKNRRAQFKIYVR